ncbi:MAG TPA: type III polyketide synthase [Anaerolineae bacterium]|jgi:alkylresorcinol/alkylpyrone synthase
MTIPAILALATGVPPNQHNQMDIHDRWLSPFINSQRARSIFAASEIDTRYSVLADSSFLADEPGTKARNDLYIQAARPLAATVIEQALDQAALTPTDIDHFIVISCTGFENPGLDVMLAADLGMRSDLRRSALIGMGCYAGLTGLDRGMLELAARPDSHVLVLAVEFGTLHFQHGKALKNMVAGALFGDGLAAAVIGPAAAAKSQAKLLDTMTHSEYAHQDLMGFHLSDHGYQIHLATSVPKLLCKIVPELVAGFLARSGLQLTDVRFWGIHPGGAKIIDYVGQALELEPAELRYSRQVLRHYGNMSSPTIFFVLDEIINQGHPQPDDVALLLAFGPGLTIELCLVRW